MTSKALSDYIGQIVPNEMKRDVPKLEQSALTGTKKASHNLSALEGKFLLVTCGNRRQSLPVDIFAGIRRHFYQNVLHAAIAGTFAGAIFTVYHCASIPFGLLIDLRHKYNMEVKSPNQLAQTQHINSPMFAN